jgi:hypothetical protein
MTLELDLELTPAGSAPLNPAKPTRRKRQPRFDRPFRYGEVVQPDRDRIGAYLEECGRKQLRLDLDTHMRIAQHVGSTWQSKWKIGLWVHSRREPREIHRVVSTKFGWRVQRRIPDRGPFHNLGHVLCGIPVLFASPDVAIAAAELLIGESPDEFWFFTWLRP